MVQNVQMVPCRVLVGDKRYCAYVLIYDKFEPFERFEPLLGPFERFERYMSTSLKCSKLIKEVVVEDINGRPVASAPGNCKSKTLSTMSPVHFVKSLTLVEQ